MYDEDGFLSHEHVCTALDRCVLCHGDIFCCDDPVSDGGEPAHVECVRARREWLAERP